MATVKTNMQGYVKDTKTGAVTNVDVSALAEHKHKVAKSKELKRLAEKIEQLEERVKKLESIQITPSPFESIFPFAQYNAGGIV
jgi:cell division protein FtsB